MLDRLPGEILALILLEGADPAFLVASRAVYRRAQLVIAGSAFKARFVLARHGAAAAPRRALGYRFTTVGILRDLAARGGRAADFAGVRLPVHFVKSAAGIQVVEYAVAHGLDLSQSKCLAWAAAHGDRKTLLWLLKLGARPCDGDFAGVLLAVKKGRAAAFELLAGALFACRHTHHNESAVLTRAVRYAVKYRRWDMARRLLKMGAIPDIQSMRALETCDGTGC